MICPKCRQPDLLCVCRHDGVIDFLVGQSGMWRTETRAVVELAPEQKAKLAAEAEAEFKRERLNEMLAATDSDPMELPGWRLELSRNRWRLSCLALAALSVGLAISKFGLPPIHKLFAEKKASMFSDRLMEQLRCELQSGKEIKIKYDGGSIYGMKKEPNE